MSTHPYYGPGNVIIDSCETCNLVWLDFGELKRAVIYGSVMGSFCCEKFGVDRFRTLTREEIEARYREFQDCTTF